MQKKIHKKFGPTYSVFNLSKIGLRYFRICMNISPASKNRLVANFVNHPNVGWIFTANGWFNLAIGLWVRDNAEINGISEQIRNILSEDDEIVLQSELTNLYSFGDRKIAGKGKPMCLIDSSTQIINLEPLEIEYIKLLALNNSINKGELLTILNINNQRLKKIKTKLVNFGVIVGSQSRYNYAGVYFKVFIDSSSRKNNFSIDNFVKCIWQDNNCVYFGRANNKYDLEFELVLDKKDDIKQYIKHFSKFKIVVIRENLYTNLYPVNKIANLKEIRDVLMNQSGKVFDFRSSKLWYLNHDAARSYLNIYNGNKKYSEIMGKSEVKLFPNIARYLRANYKGTFNVVDIGSGDGLKGRLFIEMLGEKMIKTYYPIDVQPIELAATLHTHLGGKYAKRPILLNIENLQARFPLNIVPGETQIYLFFGGTYGNFKPTDINKKLKKIISNSSNIFVSMPISDYGKSDQEIVDSYYSPQYENIALGPLKQIGFKKENFTQNEQRKDYIVHIAMENRCVVGCLILKEDIKIFGKIFKQGTIFKMLTSWKPDLDDFKQALNKDFSIVKIFNNKDMAVALIDKK